MPAISASYLEWLATKAEVRSATVRAAIAAEVKRRGFAPSVASPTPVPKVSPVATPPDVIDAGTVLDVAHQVLAQQWAGDHARMKQLDEVVKRLKSLAHAAGLMDESDGEDSVPF